MKLMRSLLLSSLLFVLTISLVLISEVQEISESPPEESQQGSTVLLSSGNFVETPFPEAKEVDPEVFAASLVGGGAVVHQEKFVEPWQPSPDIQIKAEKSIASHEDALPDFANALINGQAEQIVGVYVPGILEMEVEQQPQADALFVSSEMGVATQFGRAANNGVIGLLAHNTSSGIQFYEMELGEEVQVIYGDGTSERYMVKSISEFQKLQTTNPMSNFVDLISGETLTSTHVFNRFYTGERHVTFQTCLEHNGDPNWGLRFIEAYPIQ